MLRTRTTRVAASACPACCALLDAATSVDDAKPKAGDVSICFYCAEVLVFDDRLRVRVAAPAQVAALGPDQLQFLQTLRAALRSKAKRATV